MIPPLRAMVISSLWLRMGFGPVFRLHPGIGSVRPQQPGFHVIVQVGEQNLIDDPSFELRVFDGVENFRPLAEISGHPIGAPRIDLRVPPVMKVVNAGMFQEAVEDADHAGYSRSPRARPGAGSRSPGPRGRYGPRRARPRRACGLFWHR